MSMVEVDVYVMATTDRSYACAKDRDAVDQGRFFYLPMSQVEEKSVRAEVYNGGRFCVLTIPEWLAIKEGLV